MAVSYTRKESERGGAAMRLRALPYSLADTPRGRCGALEDVSS